jgi:hypothetical protein
LAFTVHVPAPTRETVAPETVQTPALLAAALKLTGRPELAVAEMAYDGPPTTAPLGAVDVNLIVWLLAAGGLTVKDCCACGAG